MPDAWPAILAIALVIIALVNCGCYAVKKRREKKMRIDRRIENNESTKNHMDFQQ